jgi:hypothetical protein
MTADGAGLSPALLILIDSNPDASFLPPGDMTGPTDQAVGLDDQFEPVSGVERNCHFEDGAGFRDIKNGAVNYAAAESDRAGFENAATSSSSTIVENDICGPGPSIGDGPIRATADKLLRHISEGAREASVHERGALPFAPFGKFDRLDDKAVGASRP